MSNLSFPRDNGICRRAPTAPFWLVALTAPSKSCTYTFDGAAFQCTAHWYARTMGSTQRRSAQHAIDATTADWLPNAAATTDWLSDDVYTAYERAADRQAWTMGAWQYCRAQFIEHPAYASNAGDAAYAADAPTANWLPDVAAAADRLPYGCTYKCSADWVPDGCSFKRAAYRQTWTVGTREHSSVRSTELTGSAAADDASEWARNRV